MGGEYSPVLFKGGEDVKYTVRPGFRVNGKGPGQKVDIKDETVAKALLAKKMIRE